MFDINKVFDEDYLYFYQDMLTPERLQSEVDFLIEKTQLNYPLKILDLACGHGRHANQLAKLGHQVTGVDLTPSFLDIAQKEAQEIGVKVDYQKGDMRQIAFSEAFDRVYLLFTAFGYFTEEENEQVLRNIYAALTPGGIFCFDTHNRDSFLTYLLPYFVIKKEANMMIDLNTFDTMTGRIHTKRTILKEKNTKTCEYSVQFYNPTEIQKLLNKIGFSKCNFYEGWNGNALQSKSLRMVIVAQK